MAKFVFNIKGDVKESKEVGTIDRDKYQINTKEDEKQEKGKDDKKQDKKEK